MPPLRRSARASKANASMVPQKTFTFKPPKASKAPKDIRAPKTQSKPKTHTNVTRVPKTEAGIALVPESTSKDPIHCLPDLCLDLVFSYFTAVQLIAIRGVSKLWRDTVDWRLGSPAFQRTQFPEVSVNENLVNSQIRGEIAEAFRREVYRHEMRIRRTPTFIRKFTKAQCWAVCGDYFAWVDTEFVNIQKVFNTGKSGDSVRRYSRKKFLRFPNINGEEYGIQAKNTQAGPGGNPLLVLLVLSGESAEWDGRISVVDVTNGKLIWDKLRKPPAHNKYHFYALNHHSFSYTQGQMTRSYSKHKPELHTLDILTGKNLSINDLSDKLKCSWSIWNNFVISHPRQNLILRNSTPHRPPPEAKTFMIMSTITLKDVAKIEIPCAHLQNCGHTGDPCQVSDLLFDDHGPCDPDAPEKLYVRNTLRGACMTRCRGRTAIFTFNIPPRKELEAAQVETSENGQKQLRTLHPEKIEIFECNLKDNQEAQIQHVHPRIRLSILNQFKNFPRGTGIFQMSSPGTLIVTQDYKKTSVPRVIQDFAEFRIAKFNGIDINFYKAVDRIVVKKLDKDLREGTKPQSKPWVECQFPGWASSSSRWDPVKLELHERYHLLQQPDGKVYLMSYEPAW